MTSEPQMNGNPSNPYGDAGGTRVGMPSTPDRANDGKHDGNVKSDLDGGQVHAEDAGRPGNNSADAKRVDKNAPGSDETTGAGSEAARGIRGANQGGSERAPGSEPLEHREHEHKSGYGGDGGAPRTSSDQR